MIETELKRIADALEKIAASAGGAKVVVNTGAACGVEAESAAGKGKPDSVKGESTDGKGKGESTGGKGAEAPSLDDTVKALQRYMKANGRDAAVELLAKYGAKRASDVAEDKRAAFVKEAS